MSLLLEALKRAERAKQEQSGQQGAAGAEMSIVDDASETVRSSAPAASARAQPAADNVSAAERKAAENLFAAKQGIKRISSPFLIVVSVLLLLMAGGGFYVWFEVTRLANVYLPAGKPARPAPGPVAAAPPNTGRAAPPQQATTQQPGVQPSRAVPEGPAPGASGTAPAFGQASVSEESGKTAGTVARSGKPQPDSAAPIRIQRSQAAIQISPVLASAYQAFTAGDLTTAEQEYRKLLKSEPGNRDALLGLAAVALKRGASDEAERYYLRQLELDPKDALAHAGLLSLKQQLDPALAESRLKILLASRPDAGFLHFALGNQYAAQSRWAEAQQAYFRAYSSDPGSADFAFNLAVSLDHLAQARLAAEYYRLALSLSASGQTNFDRAQASARIKELER